MARTKMRSRRFHPATEAGALIGALLLAGAMFGGAEAIPRRNFPVSIAVSPAGDVALVGNEERAGEVWSVPDLKLVRVLEAEKRSYARWHPSQPRVALFSTNLWIYSTDNWRLLHHSVAAFIDVAFHGEKAQLVGLQQTGEGQYSLFISDLEQNPQSSTFAITDTRPNRILYAGGERFVLLGSDGRATMWDVGSRALVAAAEMAGMQGPLGADVVLGTEPRIAWLSQDTGRAGIVSLPGLQPVTSFDAHRRGFGEAIRFRPDGTVLATGATFPDATVQLWDAATGARLGRKSGVQALDLAWSADSQSLYVCDRQLETVRSLQVAEIPNTP